jgi:hypothetical protein
MNEEEKTRIILNQQERETASKQQTAQLTQTQQALLLGEQERSMIKDQLDLSEELERIEHLLKGDILKRDSRGQLIWEAPEDSEMIILSEHGIHLIMNSISFYINKNTLLSNYDETTINAKMEDFASDLNDTVFMEYEKVFKYPTFEDCKKVLEARIENKTKLREFAYEMVGKEIKEGEVKKEIINELEGEIEREIDKIKEQIIKNKLKRFALIIREVQDAVHSTYLRAWKGDERRTLRQHINISEIKGGNISPQREPSRLNPINWVRS